jgi:hypothetical protein
MFDDSEPAAKIYGKYPGIVVDNQPPAGADQFQGEIKVRISSILDEDRQPIEAWAKPCFHPGFFFIPEVDDQVWVEFVAGDIDFPIWTGVWYPQGATPQTADGQAPVTENKVIRTASGHVMELDDDGGKIVIVDKNDNKVTLDDQGITITDKSSNEITMDSSGVTVVDASGNEIAMASSGVTVKSNAIKLGSDAGMESYVLGTQFKTKVVTFMAQLLTHTHVGNLGAPTSPPTTPLDLDVPLSTKIQGE